MVVPNGQADQAGIRRGDVLCFSGSHGQEEILYEQFIAMAASDMRPLQFDVRRIETIATKVSHSSSSGTSSDGNKNSQPTHGGTTTKSAEDYARRQAVIAAAEARERAHKAKTKPLPKKDALPVLLSTADKRRLEREREELVLQQQQLDNNNESESEETRRAKQAAKAKEAELTAQLGYNPFESATATAGQARNATVAVTHGALNAGNTTTSAAPSLASNNQRTMAAIPTVRPPAVAVTSTDDFNDNGDETKKLAYEAYTTMITTNDDVAVVKTSFGIMRKLICNAITKGQDDSDGEAAAKFRRIRLSNPKINEAISQVRGALEIMLAVGFQMVEEGGETYLVYPWKEPIPSWLNSCLQQMETYEQQSTADPTTTNV
jgi:hypothetical protein